MTERALYIMWAFTHGWVAAMAFDETTRTSKNLAIWGVLWVISMSTTLWARRVKKRADEVERWLGESLSQQ